MALAVMCEPFGTDIAARDKFLAEHIYRPAEGSEEAVRHAKRAALAAVGLTPAMVKRQMEARRGDTPPT